MLPASAISFSAINQELGYTSNQQLSVNDSRIRRLAATGNSGQNQSGGTTFSVSNLLSRSRNFVNITGTTVNFHLYNYVAGTGNYSAGKNWTIMQNNSGVVMGGSDTGRYGLITTGNSGDIVDIYNYGYIVGCGGYGGKGEGGNGYNRGSAEGGYGGGSGGNALYANYPINVWNYGAIWGGGGGGGGGVGSNSGGKSRGPRYGGSGGGGAGYYNGPGGAGAVNNEQGTGPGGSAGSLDAGGAPSINGGYGGGPGNGGDSPYYGGGAAGYWAIGSGNISWGNVGDVRGQTG